MAIDSICFKYKHCLISHAEGILTLDASPSAFWLCIREQGHLLETQENYIIEDAMIFRRFSEFHKVLFTF